MNSGRNGTEIENEPDIMNCTATITHRVTRQLLAGAFIATRAFAGWRPNATQQALARINVLVNTNTAPKPKCPATTPPLIGPQNCPNDDALKLRP